MNEPKDISWKKLSEKVYQAGYRKMIEKTFQLPAGNVETFDISHGGEIVCILPVTSDNQVVLTKQYRPAQERILTELPGGGVKPNETHEQAASRELLEETGYTGDLIFICQSLQSAYNTAVRYNYIALNCVKVGEPQLEDNQEPSEVTLMNLEEFKKHLYSSQITDVATGFYGLNYLKSKTDT